MKMHEVVTSYSALGELAQTKLPTKAAYTVAKNLKKLEADYEIFTDQRQKILTDMYTRVPDNPNMFVPNDPNAGPKALQDLMDLEVEVTTAGLMKCTIGDFGHSCEITPAVLMTLDWMIVEEAK
jgi:hypothetical protein